jgi:hypothetical protein
VALPCRVRVRALVDGEPLAGFPAERSLSLTQLLTGTFIVPANTAGSLTYNFASPPGGAAYQLVLIETDAGFPAGAGALVLGAFALILQPSGVFMVVGTSGITTMTLVASNPTAEPSTIRYVLGY